MKLALIMAGAVAALVPASADAAVNIYINDDGTDTLVQVIGSIDLRGFTAITPYGTEPGSDEIQGHSGTLYAGDPKQGLQAYTGLTGNNSYGNYNISFANSGAGTGFGISGVYTPSRLLLPRTYASGDAINGTATFRYRTIADIGLIRGDYIYSSSSDSITVHVGQSAPAVPEPAAWAMMVVGIGAVGGTTRRRRAQRAAVRA